MSSDSKNTAAPVPLSPESGPSDQEMERGVPTRAPAQCEGSPDREIEGESLSQKPDIEAPESLSESATRPTREGGEGEGASFDRTESEQEYWEQLKQRFVNSSWFARVDEIFRQSALLRTLRTLARPAEYFFNAATEVFMVRQTLGGFLEMLRKRFGPAWDARLVKPAYAFFRAAQLVTRAVGAGHCIEGFVRLGRAKVEKLWSDPVDELMNTWESVLGGSFFTHSKSGGEGKTASSARGGEEAKEYDLDSNAFHGGASNGTPDRCLKAGTAPAQGLSQRQNGSVKKMKRCKMGRHRQVPAPYSKRASQKEALQDLKAFLMEKGWFTRVGAILRQNQLIDALARKGDKKFQPAEHFYITSMQIIKKQSKTSEVFLKSLSAQLGFAWDDRLVPPARQLFCAYKAEMRRDNSYSNLSNALCGAPPATIPATYGHAGASTLDQRTSAHSGGLNRIGIGIGGHGYGQGILGGDGSIASSIALTSPTFVGGSNPRRGNSFGTLEFSGEDSAGAATMGG